MDLFHNMLNGLSVALSTVNLGWALIGSLLGLLLGVVSGLGPMVAMVLLLPMMSVLGPLPCLILLVSVHCGSQYAAMNLRIMVPECGSVVPSVMATDGYQMARQGRGGIALSLASLGSGVAALSALVVVILLAPLLSHLAVYFEAPELFSLMVLSLVGAVVLSPGSVSKALGMILLGVLLSRVGAAEISDLVHHTLGFSDVFNEIPLVVFAMAVFVFAEVMVQLGQPSESRQVASAALGALKPSREQIELVKPSVFRGAALGALMGLLPGRAAVLASVAAHKIERHLAAHEGLFGRGDLRGVTGPGAACQAGGQTSFLPMLTFGIPLNAVMALLVGAMMIKGIHPGPQVISRHPEFFWGLLGALGISHVILLLANLPLMAVWSRLLTLPYRVVFPTVILLGCVGLYGLRGQVQDVYLAAGLAVAGYLFHKMRCPVGPLLLGFILGPMMESSLREALQTHGGWGILITRPLSAGLLIAASVLVVIMVIPSIQQPREALFKGGQ